MGEQYLYKVTATLYENGLIADTDTKLIGLRVLTVVRKKDKYGESFCHSVNGIEFFAMGVDYVPEDAILSRITPDRTKTLLSQCKEANFNTIRVWGGGFYPGDEFYDYCDKLGLIVFEDLMYACVKISMDENLLNEFKAEVAENLKRIRHHACIGIISGNNEVEICYDWWKEFPNIEKYKSRYLEVFEDTIPKIVSEICPNIPYISSSPTSCGHFIEPDNENYGDSHYWDVWHGDKPFAEYRKHYFRYLSEFGFESFPNIKTINSFTYQKDRNVFSRVMESHQRCFGANKKIISYLSETYKYPTNLETLVYASQLLQADAMRYAVEHLRRNRGRCMGALYWQLNDVWPVASWSSIDYYGRFKALQYIAKRFFSPILISCHETSETDTRPFLTLEPDYIDYSTKAQLFVNNDTLNEISGTVRWHLSNIKGKVLKSGEKFITVPPMSVVALKELDFNKTDILHNYFWYDFDEGKSYGSVLFTAPKHFEYPNPNLSVSKDGNTITVKSEAFAQRIEVYSPDDDIILEDNFFDMERGLRQIKILKGTPNKLLVRSVYDIK